MYYFIAKYDNMDTLDNRVELIVVCDYARPESDCYMEALEIALDAKKYNETLLSLEFMTC